MKKYKVTEYATGKEVMIGTAEECAKIVGFKDKGTFQRYVKYIENGKYTGKKHGYIACYYDEDEVIHEKNLKVLDAFYDKYRRSPTADEFKKCNGDYLMAMRRSKSWCEYLEECGYDRQEHQKTVEVYDANGKLCYVGTSKEVAKKYYIARSYIGRLVKTKASNQDGYTFKYRNFTGIDGND